MSESIKCECGKPADAEYSVWNGKNYLPVCMTCYNDPETIATETCVSYAEGNEPSLEECLRIELGHREIPWTPELQALIDKRYCEWYLEAAI